MESTFLSFILEMSNLESDLSILLNLETPEDLKLAEKAAEVSDECFVRVKSRLNIVIGQVREMIEEADQTEISIGKGMATQKDIVTTFISTAFLNLFAKISLNCNCNLVSSKVVLDRLSSSTKTETSVQVLYETLIEKVSSFNE